MTLVKCSSRAQRGSSDAGARCAKNDKEQTEKIISPERTQQLSNQLLHVKFFYVILDIPVIPVNVIYTTRIVIKNKQMEKKKNLCPTFPFFRYTLLLLAVFADDLSFSLSFLFTVKIVLIPIAQEIIMPFRVDAPFRLLKEHFARLLRLPHYVLQISHSGKFEG